MKIKLQTMTVKSDLYQLPKSVLKHFLLLFILNFSNAFATIVHINSGSISTPVIWDDPTDFTSSGYEAGIQIDVGELILDGVTLEMDEGSQISLNYGTVLKLINGAVIKSSDQAHDKTWLGIRTLSDGTLMDAHFANDNDFPDPTVLDDEPAWTGNIDEGSNINPIVYINESTISDAHIAVWSDFGMIVRARNSSFTDNARSIKISNYEHPFGTWGWHQQFNASYIMDCTFDWFKQNGDFDLVIDLIHIDLFKVRGVRIGGCDFLNDISNQEFNCDTRGVGIKALDANFALAMSGNSFCGDNSAYVCTNNCYTDPNPYPSGSQRNSFARLYKGYFDSGQFRLAVSCQGFIDKELRFFQ